MGIQAWSATDVGRKRKKNEDACLVDATQGLYVVADGMGGHAGGDIASAHCVQAIQAQVTAEHELVKKLESDPTHEATEAVQGLVQRAVERACREIHTMSEADAERHGMGTTCVLLLACGKKGIIGHVGDSRVYLRRGGRTHQLTEDHSLVEEQVKRGLLSREEAERSEVRNVITRAVGVQSSVEVDTLVVDLLPGDIFLLCSDGLHGYLKGDELGPMLDAGDGARERLPQRLVDLANNRGGRDNVTALIVAVLDAAAVHEADNADQKVEILRRIPLFQYMTYKELLALLSIARARHHLPKDVIVQEGATGDDMYVVIRGEVDVTRGDVSFTHLKTGGHFGEMALVDSAPRSASVIAVEPTSVVALGRDQLLKLMRKDSLMAVKLLWAFTQVLSERLRQTNEAVVLLKDEVERLRSATGPDWAPAPFGEDA